MKKREVLYQKKWFSFLVIGSIVLLAFFLRSYHVTQVPYGLYIDEIAIGINADTILHHGTDEWGERLPLFFRSFGDYKMPVYIYATALSEFLFGKNDFAIRFPSIAAGTLSILLFFLFLQTLCSFETNKQVQTYIRFVPLLGAFLLSISPWHIQFSRGGFETNLALFFFLAALYTCLKFLEQEKKGFFILSCIAFLASIYTYHSYRIITPIVFAAFVLFLFLKKRGNSFVLVTSLFFLLGCLPMILFSLTSHGSERFVATSAFIEYPVNSVREKMLLYPLVYLHHYLQYFSSYFLFVFGDGFGRHQLPFTGPLYVWQFPFLVLGLYVLCTKKMVLLKQLTLFLLFVAPLAAALARPSPHTLRSLLLVIPLTILISIGLSFCLTCVQKMKRVFLLLLLLIGGYQFVSYLHTYAIHYPVITALDWGGNYKQVITDATAYHKKYPLIIVDKNLPFVSYYFRFYNPSLKPEYVDTFWKKSASVGATHLLYIRPYYGERTNPHIIHNVYLPGKNKDIFAQFWDI